MNSNIRNWARNDPFSAGHLNEPLPTVRSVRTITGINGIEVTQTEAGTTIKGPPAPYNGGMGVEHYLATITNTGPDSASDYSDSRYWVKLVYVVNGSTYDKIAVNNVVPPKVPISAGNSPDAFQATVTATNLGEWTSSGGAHGLPTDGSRLVHVWGFYDVGDTSGNRGHRYVMSEGGFGLIPVNVTQSGGINGNSTTAASYTYNATNAITGTSITGGPFSVTCSRVRNGPATAASHGTGYFNSSGTFVLWWVDEKLGTSVCS